MNFIVTCFTNILKSVYRIYISIWPTLPVVCVSFKKYFYYPLRFQGPPPPIFPSKMRDQC
jgi:hypothetical protein